MASINRFPNAEFVAALERQYLYPRFVVNENVEISIVDSLDPDVAWDDIEEIILYAPYCIAQCSNCVFAPAAAKVAPCGHLYCGRCILQSTLKGEGCTKCSKPLKIADLKSALVKRFKLGGEMNFQLMRREVKSAAVEIVSEETDRNGISFSSTAIKSSRYSKFLMSNNDYILNIIAREEKELIEEAEVFEYGMDTFTVKALDLLKERRQKVEELTVGKGKHEQHSATKVLFGEDLPLVVYEYFYQCNDGDRIYMHDLNLEMLEWRYRKLARIPLQITEKVLQVERFLLETIPPRKIKVVELDLKVPVVCNDTLFVFKERLLRRRELREAEKKTAVPKVKGAPCTYIPITGRAIWSSTDNINNETEKMLQVHPCGIEPPHDSATQNEKALPVEANPIEGKGVASGSTGATYTGTDARPNDMPMKKRLRLLPEYSGETNRQT